jgi:hypothetical protein
VQNCAGSPKLLERIVGPTNLLHPLLQRLLMFYFLFLEPVLKNLLLVIAPSATGAAVAPQTLHMVFF